MPAARARPGVRAARTPTLPSWWVRDHGPDPVADPDQARILAAWARSEHLRDQLRLGQPWNDPDRKALLNEIDRLLTFEEAIGMALSQHLGSAALIAAVEAINTLHRARQEP